MIGNGTGGAKAPPVSHSGKVILLAVLFLAACSSQPPATETFSRAEALGWQKRDIDTGDFTLRTMLSPGNQSSRGKLAVYVEGDGNAWLSPTRVSPDPTPRRATGLSLALADPGNERIAYVGRPCQYVRRVACKPQLWTSARYGEASVAALDRALSRLKQLAGASSLELAGYSGGGTLAMLAAVRRDDVSGVITVAANLDIDEWVRIRNLTPLHDSMNPAALGPAMAGLPQLHVSGAEDEVVPVAVQRSFLRRTGQGDMDRLLVVPGMGHRDDWSEIWPQVVQAARSRLAGQGGRQLSFAPRADRRPSSH
jgi:pimeloyl-ACP methyl ester carboxylesterase